MLIVLVLWCVLKCCYKVLCMLLFGVFVWCVVVKVVLKKNGKSVCVKFV